MLNFTRQERYVVYFLAITLGVGAILRVVRNQQISDELRPARFYEEEQRYKEISREINSQDYVISDRAEITIEGSSSSGDSTNLDVSTQVLMLDLNSASISELTSLPGIGPALAQRIRAFTDQNGPFKNKKDIILVKGIGNKLYARIQGLVTTE